MAMLAKTVFNPLADASADSVHDLLIPELNTIQASLELIRNEMDWLRTGIQVRDEAMRAEMKQLSEKLDRILNLAAVKDLK